MQRIAYLKLHALEVQGVEEIIVRVEDGTSSMPNQVILQNFLIK